MAEHKERKFVAIFFADIVGYTALMQASETNAASLLQKFREVIDREVGGHHGRIINFYGDGCLVVFDELKQALETAVAIQMAFSKGLRVPARIGLHCGEVVFGEGNAYGDSVNITSRIESIGIAGAILLSKAFRQMVKNQSDHRFTSLGPIAFKNVARPVEIFALADPGWPVPTGEDLKNNAKGIPAQAQFSQRPWYMSWPVLGGVILLLLSTAYLIGQLSSRQVHYANWERSVAILPFKNLNGDQEQRFFSEGISQDILSQLSGIEDLHVISFNSAKTFADSDQSPREIAKALNAKHLLTGSVQRAGQQLRIRAALLDATTDKQIWAESYDRKMEALFDIQSEVSTAIANVLKAELLPGVEMRINQKPTHDLEAYQLYSEGRFHWNKRTLKDLQQAIELFQRAIAVDPGFALAYAGLAQSCITMASSAYLPPDYAYPKSKAYAEKALQLNPNEADAYATLGQYYALYDIDFDQSKAMHDKSVQLKPGDATIRQWYAEDLCWMGETARARQEIDIAKRLDPASLAVKLVDRALLMVEGKIEPSIRQLEALWAEHPNFEVIIPNLAFAYLRLGQYQRVEDLANTITAIPGWREILLSSLYATRKQQLQLEQLKKSVTEFPDSSLRTPLTYLVSRDLALVRGDIKRFTAMTDTAIFVNGFVHPSILQTLSLPDSIWSQDVWQDFMRRRSFKMLPREGMGLKN